MSDDENASKKGGPMGEDWEYVGFWSRTVAGIVDLILQFIITVPLTISVYGQFMSPDARTFRGTADFLINAALPAVAVIMCWLRWGATPGKLAMAARVVDADTGEALTPGQAALRYFGYILSALPIGVGFFWAGLDRRKQGWHDKIAGTVVVRPAGKEQMRFDRRATSFRPTEPRFLADFALAVYGSFRRTSFAKERSTSSSSRTAALGRKQTPFSRPA